MRVLMTFCMLLLATSFMGQISFQTGSATLDSDLQSINTTAELDIKAFNADLHVKYNISEKKLEEIKEKGSLSPAELYLALEIGRLANQNVDDVVGIYIRDKSKGWGHVAKHLGIKPGSTQFHELKNAVKSKKDKSAKAKPNNPGKGNKGQANGKSKGKKK